MKIFAELWILLHRHFNSEVTTQIAKMNVEREYAVVGSWEDTNVTLAVLEAYIPKFFADARKVYYSRFTT